LASKGESALRSTRCSSWFGRCLAPKHKRRFCTRHRDGLLNRCCACRGDVGCVVVLDFLHHLLGFLHHLALVLAIVVVGVVVVIIIDHHDLIIIINIIIITIAPVVTRAWRRDFTLGGWRLERLLCAKQRPCARRATCRCVMRKKDARWNGELMRGHIILDEWGEGSRIMYGVRQCEGVVEWRNDEREMRAGAGVQTWHKGLRASTETKRRLGRC